jgi:hypothetical protein
MESGQYERSTIPELFLGALANEWNGLWLLKKSLQVLGRPQIQADNVGRLAFELGIVAGHVTLQSFYF